MLTARSGRIAMLASPARTTTMPYFRSLAGQYSPRTMRSRNLRWAMLHCSMRPGPRHALRATCNGCAFNCLARTLISHLGFEPQGGLHARAATSPARLLFDLVRDADKADGLAASAADSYMQLAIYDLIGALFAPSDPSPVSRHADKLFARIRGVVKDGFADPDFGPREVAVEAGISLRYLQKLFTARSSTCSEFIYSLRLDHAARLLHRRASLETSQPLTEIAYACGFRDYTHFARRFRHRFGYPPGGRAEGETGRAGTGERAPRAHDVQPPAV